MKEVYEDLAGCLRRLNSILRDLTTAPGGAVVAELKEASEVSDECVRLFLESLRLLAEIGDRFGIEVRAGAYYGAYYKDSGVP
ncbi:MAG: hypothetical protein ACXQT2_04460 [Methanotrichaceae archaeon]